MEEDREGNPPGTTPGAMPPEDDEIPTGAMSSGELRAPDNSPAPVDHE